MFMCYRRSPIGRQHSGQVWSYEPARRRLTLVLVFGPDSDVQAPGDS
ncbi:UNVERIFIED_ORG: hypothetical protein CLV66_1451, partial [Actinomadura viridilutea]